MFRIPIFYFGNIFQEFLAQMMQAEQNKHNVLKDLSRRIFEKFSQSHMLWQKAITCISILDVIISLSEYTRLQSGDMCVPEVRITEPNEKVSLYVIKLLI